MKYEVTALKDMIQEVHGNIEIPEIRVWCHPHYVKKSGEDYFEVFGSFKEAFDFISGHKECEEHPLIAYNGLEINIFTEN